MAGSHSNITLVAPGLGLPLQILRDLSFDLPIPGLRGLLALSTPCSGEGLVAEPIMVAALQPGSIESAAPLRLRALGQEPGDDVWLCLDPVHLGFHDRMLVVQDPARLDLSLAEAQSLATDLAPLFAPLGELHVSHPTQWHLRLTAASPAFPPLAAAIGGHATLGLPKDPRWRDALNEAQMCLHQHSVNHRRTQEDRVPVNSLWPWGSGRAPARPSQVASRRLAVYADDAVLRGLTLQHGQQALTTPASVHDIDFTRADDYLISLDSLRASISSADAYVWRNTLSDLDRDWFAPLLERWQSHAMTQCDVRLCFPGKQTTRSFALMPNRLSARLHRMAAPMLRKIGLAAPATVLDDLADG